MRLRHFWSTNHGSQEGKPLNNKEGDGTECFARCSAAFFAMDISLEASQTFRGLHSTTLVKLCISAAVKIASQGHCYLPPPKCNLHVSQGCCRWQLRSCTPQSATRQGLLLACLRCGLQKDHQELSNKHSFLLAVLQHHGNCILQQLQQRWSHL